MQNDNTDLIKTGLSFPGGFWGKKGRTTPHFVRRDPLEGA